MEEKIIKIVRQLDESLPKKKRKKRGVDIPDFISFDGVGVYLSKQAKKERKLYSRGLKQLERNKKK